MLRNVFVNDTRVLADNLATEHESAIPSSSISDELPKMDCEELPAETFSSNPSTINPNINNVDACTTCVESKTRLSRLQDTFRRAKARHKQSNLEVRVLRRQNRQLRQVSHIHSLLYVSIVYYTSV